MRVLLLSHWFSPAAEVEEDAWESRLASEGFSLAREALGLLDNVAFSVMDGLGADRDGGGGGERKRGGLAALLQSVGGGGERESSEGRAPAVRASGLTVDALPASPVDAMDVMSQVVSSESADGAPARGFGEFAAIARMASTVADPEQAMALVHAIVPCPDPGRFDTPILPEVFEMDGRTVAAVLCGGDAERCVLLVTAQSGCDAMSLLMATPRIQRILDATCDGQLGVAKLRDLAFRSKCNVALDEAFAGGVQLHDDIENILRLAKLKDPAVKQ